MKASVTQMGAVVLMSGCLAAWGLTEEWRYAANAAVAQIVSDGKGGCALVERATNDICHVVWLNKKGEVVQVVGPIPFSSIGPTINECTPKQLLVTAMLGIPMMVQADTKGKVTPLVALNGFVIGFYAPAPYALNRMGDAKGFFVVNVNTNTLAYSVVRYRYK